MFRNIALVGRGTTKISCINFLNRNSIVKNDVWKRNNCIYELSIRQTTNLGLIFFNQIDPLEIEYYIKVLKNVDSDYLVMWPDNYNQTNLNCKKSNIVFLPKEINWGLILSTLPASK